MWTAILVTLAVSVTVLAFRRCRQANKLIERILVEELGTTGTVAPSPAVALVPYQAPAPARMDMDRLLGA